MKKFDVVNDPKSVPVIILGCMRMPSLSVKEAENIISVSLELGINFFDKRLKTDYLDALLLHRPDLIFEPEQVAEAFDTLFTSGKVRHFGVSNVPTLQMELLRKYIKQPLYLINYSFRLSSPNP